MASVTKHKNGWRAHVNKNGLRKSKILNSKTAARDWAARIEYELGDGKFEVSSKRTFKDLLERYRDNESVKKRSVSWEVKKIDHLLSIMPDIALADINAPYFAQWRDTRLKATSSGTVNREWNLLNVAINTAIKEWEWLSVNPLSKVKRPAQPKSRDRLISDDEIESLMVTTGYVDFPLTIASRVCGAFLFSIETAMRAGEALSLTPETVDLEARTATLPLTKNGSSRVVPLSTRAVEILKACDCDFNLTSRQLDSNFRKSRDMAGIEGLHFHDSRHQAITNLAKKVEVLDLARITGIKDLKILMVYYNETAESIAKKLD